MNARLFDAAQYSDLAQQMQRLRTEAHDGMQSIRDEIQRLAEELRAVQHSVCLEDAAAKIEGYLAHRLEERRARLYLSQRAAVDLASYHDIRTASFSGDGSLISSTSSTPFSALYIAKDDPMDVLALLWGTKEIKAFARAAAMESGAKPKADGGLSVDEAMQRSAAIWEELERLEQTRIEAVAALKDLQNLRLPTVAVRQESPKPIPVDVDNSFRAPTVMVRGADGVMRPQQSDPFAEFYRNQPEYSELEG